MRLLAAAGVGILCTVAFAGPSDGIRIVASPAVSAAARQEVVRILDGIAATRPSILAPYKTMPGFRIVIRGVAERTQDLPDVIAFPGLRAWVISVGGDARVGGGFGCNVQAPIVVVAEQNLLGLSWDPWRGESTALHEFVHTFLTCLPPSNLRATVDSAYRSARARGLWADTYAAVNVDEYWAEGVQSYFNSNLEASPANGVHNFVNTRAELAFYDPALYGLVRNFFGQNEWSYHEPIPGRWGALSTLWKGTVSRLDVVNNGANNLVQLGARGNYSGQYWRMESVDGTYFRLKSLFTGDARCLDILNNGVNDQLRLNPCGNYSGQMFRRESGAVGGYFRLRTMFTGSDRCVEVTNSGAQNQLAMRPCNTASAQLWRFDNP